MKENDLVTIFPFHYTTDIHKMKGCDSMKCTKKLALSAYLVKYHDLREPKPRTIHEELYIVDEDGKKAMELLGVELTGFIKTRYERGGYFCRSVEKVGSRCAYVDLAQAWEIAEETCHE